jgi:N-acetylmuramoyl-L-alanine amidase
MKLFKFILVIFLVLSFQHAYATTKILSLRIANQINNNSSRVVFEFSERMQYYINTSVHGKIKVKIFNAYLVNKRNVSNLRAATFNDITFYQNGKDFELIFTLKQALKFKYFLLRNPYRLVIDFFSTNTHSQLSTLSSGKTKYKTPVSAKLADSYYKQDARDIVIVIDPGHGGKDPGAIGASGLQEKAVVLSIARKLQQNLGSYRNFQAVLTRNGDYFISLPKRLRIAHENKADMFISIHADAFKYSSSCGATIFALSQRGATSVAARWLAKKENESELGHAMAAKSTILRSVLIDLAQTATIKASLEIGRTMLANLVNIARLHKQRVEQAGFLVLKSPDIPSLLVETGFISDPREEAKLRDSYYQQKIADALAQGIGNYFVRHKKAITNYGRS